MSEFKIGDKVNFLSTVGGGKVTKIIDSRMVMVEVEDGFEIPTLISDLVLDYRSMPAPSKQQEKVDKVQKEVQGQELLKQQQAEEARKGGLRRFAKEAEKEGIYMAFVPHEQQWLLTGSLDVVLVNHTPYEMLYTFTIKEEDKFTNVDYGQIDKYEKIVIETISRDDLEYWLNGVVQAILTAETSDCVLLPLNAPFSLRVGRFMKEGSYLPSGILGEKSVMICLSELIALKHGDGDFTKIMKEGVGAQAPAKTLVKKEAPITAMRRRSFNRLIVCIKVVVLPLPGADIRLSRKVPCSFNSPRKRLASLSLSSKTLFLISIIFSSSIAMDFDPLQRYEINRNIPTFYTKLSRYPMVWRSRFL